jgi:hypothetical protein
MMGGVGQAQGYDDAQPKQGNFCFSTGQNGVESWKIKNNSRL